MILVNMCKIDLAIHSKQLLDPKVPKLAHAIFQTPKLVLEAPRCCDVISAMKLPELGLGRQGTQPAVTPLCSLILLTGCVHEPK